MSPAVHVRKYGKSDQEKSKAGKGYGDGQVSAVDIWGSALLGIDPLMFWLELTPESSHWRAGTSTPIPHFLKAFPWDDNSPPALPLAFLRYTY